MKAILLVVGPLIALILLVGGTDAQQVRSGPDHFQEMQITWILNSSSRTLGYDEHGRMIWAFVDPDPISRRDEPAVYSYDDSDRLVPMDVLPGMR